MFNILTNLYLVHQNVFAFVILLAITAIIFAVKHNYKIALIIGVLFVVANIGCYKMTNNSTWERVYMRMSQKNTQSLAGYMNGSKTLY